MTIKNIICGPTGLQPWLFDYYMEHLRERHPDTHLVTLRHIGAVPIESSVEFFGEQVAKVVKPDEPYMVSGDSQGALVAMMHALDHQDLVKHVIAVGGPFHGAWLSRVFWFFPSAREMFKGSRFLADLVSRIPELDGNVTNILTPSELVMDAMSCYLDPEMASNVLVGNDDQIKRFFEDRRHRALAFDRIETAAKPVHHLNAMMSPQLRSVIWRTVDQVSEANGFAADGIPDEELDHQGFILKRALG